jgi:hypothetical protein
MIDQLPIDVVLERLQVLAAPLQANGYELDVAWEGRR